MPLNNINPTETNAWKALKARFEETKDVHMKSLFSEDKNRKENFSLQFEDLTLDFSKNRIDAQTLDLLIELTAECNLNQGIEKYFNGDKINETENRAVLHTALRNNDEGSVEVDGFDVMPEVRATLNKTSYAT